MYIYKYTYVYIYIQIYTYMLYMYIHACIVCTIIPNNASWTPFPPLFPALACMTGCIPVPWKTPHPIMFVASVGLSYFGEPKFCGPCWKGFPVQNLFCCICWLVGLFLHYSYAQNTKKKWPSQHFWSLDFRIVFPHLSFAIQTLQLTQWQFQLERPRVDVLSYVMDHFYGR